MKTIAISLLLLAIVPLEARALPTYDSSDVLSYVAMPLAVSAVCDVRGVQTGRVGELVAYMNQADVAPADFVEVFRYVPVALVMSTDNRPDFVEWVHGEIGRGVMDGDLVTAMEAQLRGYDDYVPVSTHRDHRRYVREAYLYGDESDYVPVVIRHHCERLIVDPLSLIDMPVAVANVCDLGLPYDRVSGLVVELNLGGVRPLQFVELMRYAPAALVVDGGYRGQPDFIQFARAQRMGGASDYRLVRALDQRLRAYDVAPQIDVSSPVYENRVSYVQNYVDPASPAFVPAIVHTRVAANIAARRGAAFNQASPAVAAAPQVQRLLSSPNAPGVIANPAEARRELARVNRVQHDHPMAAAPPFVAPPAAVHGRIENRARPEVIAGQPAVALPSVESSHRGNRREGEHVAPAQLPTPMISSAPPRHEHDKGHAGPPQAFVPPPAAVQPSPHEHEKSHAGPPPQAAIAAPPVVATRAQEHGRGHATTPPVAAAPAPAVSTATAPPPPPPGQQKKKEKGKDQ